MATEHFYGREFEGFSSVFKCKSQFTSHLENVSSHTGHQ